MSTEPQDSKPLPSQATLLLKLAADASLFVTHEGEPCASVRGATTFSRNVHPLRSAEFRDWLTNSFVCEYSAPPSADALRDALRALESRATQGENGHRKFDHRIGYLGDPYAPSQILLDLGQGKLAQIDRNGWSITDNLDYHFRPSNAALSLPEPIETAGSASLDEFCQLMNLAGKQRAQVLSWISTALRPVGPYPVLVLAGPPGSGKSTLARAIRSLIDPSAAPLRRLPRRDRSLLQLTVHNWILAFDMVHRISPSISEALAAISTGDAFEIAQPDLREPLNFQVARPIVVVTPRDETRAGWTPPRPLANRTITVELKRIESPRPEAAITRDLANLLPAAVGALCNTVAEAMRNIRDVDLAVATRFPDSAYWTVAAARTLGLTKDAIVSVFADTQSAWRGSDPLRDAVHAFLGTQEKQRWSGDASVLMQELRAISPDVVMPSTPKGLSQVLPRVEGVRTTHEKRHKDHRIITLTKRDDASQHQTFGRFPQPASEF